MSETQQQLKCGSWVPAIYNDYKYGVIGFESGFDNCPLFTNFTKTWFGAKIVERRFRRQGLLTRIYDHSKEIAPGLNPYKEWVF